MFEIKVQLSAVFKVTFLVNSSQYNFKVIILISGTSFSLYQKKGVWVSLKKNSKDISLFFVLSLQSAYPSQKKNIPFQKW